MIDLLTIGEALIRLSVPPGDLLIDTPTLDVHIAGAESNVAVAAARLGHSVRWLSRLTDNIWGRRIVQDVSSAGVDCSAVVWTPDDRIGTFYLEAAGPPRASSIFYDRAFSAASRMSPATFDLGQVAQARFIHLTGITAALSESCYALVSACIKAAAERHIPLIFDVNFRARLWTAETCAAQLTPLLSQIDTLIVARSDAAAVFGISGQPLAVLEALQARFDLQRVVLTLGEAGAEALDGSKHYTAAAHPVQIIDRIGAGDSFAAGVISGLLRGDLGLGLRYGVAMSALKMSTKGDRFRFALADVQQLVDSATSGLSATSARPLR